MPASQPPIKAHPGRPFFTLKDAAKEGYLIHVKCNGCRRSVYFYPADLMTFIDPKHPLHIPPFPCTRCDTMEFVQIFRHYPRPGDYGRLPIRKLAEVKTVRVWQNVALGD